MDVSIIIVNYNTKELLKNCLNSVYKNTKNLKFEVIVSDNGSTDSSIEMLQKDFPKVNLIQNGENLGFGAANNRGLKSAKGKYIFYLNSDTVLLNNAVKIFYDYFESNNKDNSLGAIGANLLDNNLNVIHSSGNFAGYSLSIKQLFSMLIKNAILSILYILHINAKKSESSDCCKFYTGEVDYITGADLFLLNDKNAYYDENFFLYFEEADLQRQMKNKNLNRILIDGPKIKHLCGGSVGTDFSIKRKASFSRIQFEVSRIKFLKKYNNNSLLLFICKLLVTLCWINPFLIKSTKKYIKTIWKI